MSREFDKKGAAFDFPDANGTFIQGMGNTGRRYPLRMFFWGTDYDQEAAAFEAALSESGTFKLEHPIYGTINTVPLGSISRRDDLKTAANQAVIEVTFFETIDLLYPAAQGDPASEVLASVDEFNVSASAQFEQSVNTETASLRASLKNNYADALNTTKSGLQDIANTQDDVRKQFDAINDSINNGIDTLIADPLTLAFQTTILIQAPARAITNIKARLSSYGDLARSIIATGTATAGINAKNSNTFHSNDVYASSYITGSVVSAVNNQFVTRIEAIEAAENILDKMDEVTVWRDDNFNSLNEIDTGEAYQKLQEAVALCAGFLVQISFSLKQERVIVLDRPRTIIDLAAEIYGAIDDQLDFLINTNNLSGSEILELKRGREIKYYV